MKLVREVSTYAAASLIAFSCDFGLLALLVQVVGWHYLVAAILSFTAGAIVAYIISVRYVFRFRRLDDWRAEFAGFATIGAVGLLINVALLTAGVELLGMHVLVAKIGAAGVTFFINYIARRLLLFTPFRGRRSDST